MSKTILLIAAFSVASFLIGSIDRIDRAAGDEKPASDAKANAVNPQAQVGRYQLITTTDGGRMIFDTATGRFVERRLDTARAYSAWVETDPISEMVSEKRFVELIREHSDEVRKANDAARKASLKPATE